IGYTKTVIFSRPTSSQDAQDVARFCAIFSIFQSNLITDPPNFARNSLIRDTCRRVRDTFGTPPISQGCGHSPGISSMLAAFAAPLARLRVPPRVTPGRPPVADAFAHSSLACRSRSSVHVGTGTIYRRQVKHCSVCKKRLVRTQDWRA